MEFHQIRTAAGGHPFTYRAIPFIDAEQSLITGQCAFEVGFSGKVLAIHGMTLPEGKIYVGDTVGELTLTYVDGSTCDYPLVVGEALWWGQRFYWYREPITSNPECNKIFREAMKLRPSEPVIDEVGYILYLQLENKELAHITYTPQSEVLPNIRAFTILKNFSDEYVYISLEPKGVNVQEREAKIRALQDIMCVSERNFPQTFQTSYPEGYIGPKVTFKGDRYADFYTNVFRYNLVDAAAKVDADGNAHTSTYAAPWYGYDAIGGVYGYCDIMWDNHVPGLYYKQSWSRDLGRSLIELVRLGRGENVAACIDWVFNYILQWETDETILFKGHRLPRHIQRCIQFIDTKVGEGSFENDGHALVSLAVWTYWKRCEQRDEWASKRWDDIKALGDWFIWQFAHPEISGATDLLWSDSEASGWPVKTGISFYVDCLAMEALRALSQIAVAQSDKATADSWLERADLLQAAIEKHYIGEDGRWLCTCESPAWKGQTNLAHIIISPDTGSMEIKKNLPKWNETDFITAQANAKTHDSSKNAFGYSHGYSIQSALLIDEIEAATKFLRECAMMIYHPITSPYLVPEDAMRIRDGVYARTGDLGNQVQQAEMLKALRIIIGVDDNGSELKITPRLPIGWEEVSVEDYPVLVNGEMKKLKFTYQKKADHLVYAVE